MNKAIGLVAVAMASSAAFAQEVKVGGYLDTQYNWSNAAGGGEGAFAFNEGAVHFSGTSGMTDFLVDMHFDTTMARVAQAYAGTKYDNGFSWKMGKFDGILGLEGNESVNNDLISQGLMFNLTSSYFQGLHVGYELSDSLGVSFVVSNNAGESMVDSASPLMAVKVESKSEGMTAYVGGEFGNIADELNYVIDLGATTSMSGFDLGLQVAMQKIGGGDTGFGFGLHAGMEVSETLGAFARFDWLNENVLGFAAWELAAGPTFALSDALNFKANWTMLSLDIEGADTAQGIDLAAIYKF
jgi:hypothetical protein